MTGILDRLFEWHIARMRVRSTTRRAALRLGALLIERRRFEDADAVLEAALARWPERPRLLHLYAMSAHEAGRYRVALARWGTLRQTDAEAAPAWCGVAANARMLDELRTAETTILEALKRFPDDLGVASEAARIFDHTARFQEAVTQWRRLIDVEPVHPDWYQGYALSLVMVGRLKEAEAILDRAAIPYPDDRGLLATRAALAMAREDWNAALAIWRVYREHHPTDPAGWEGQGKTIAAIHTARMEATDPSANAVKIDIGLVEDDPTRALLLGFDSIGADCEFGLVQRRFGAEPLGLLRFNDVSLPNLMDALAAGFEGMGEAQNTSLVTSRNGEIYVADRRWSLGMHTFLFTSSQDMATLAPKMCSRVAYLRDKLLEDLAAGEKVIVFKSDAIDLEGLLALHAALRVHGPVRLLHVRRASVPLADRPFAVTPGQVFRVQADLFVGFLGRMGNAGHEWDIAFDEWVTVCGGVSETTPFLP